jgi:hypothetical protein
MMRRGQGERVPIPTIEDLEHAIMGEMEMAACSGLRHGPLAVMTLALNSTATATVCVDELSALHMCEALKALFPNIATPVASPAKVTRLDNGDVAVQVGHQSAE